MTQVLKVVGISDVGPQRDHNEDCFLVGGLVQRDGTIELTFEHESMLFERYGILCAVADGMGGHQSGALASRLALEALALEAFDIAPRYATRESFAKELSARIVSVHSMLIARGESEYDLRGMGTTLAAVFIRTGQLILATVGDTRIYRYREGYLTPLTTDHAISVGPVKTPGSGPRRVLTNSIGGGSGLDCRPEIDFEVSFETGDILLLCTDGLVDALEETEIREVLRSAEQLPAAASSLIEMARRRNAADNVTVLLLESREK